MKKTAVVLCILLSLFIVSCAEPENAPKVPDAGTGDESGGKPSLPDRDVEFIVSDSIFDAASREYITKVGFSYKVVPGDGNFSEPVEKQLADGKASVGTIGIKAGSSLDYRICGYTEEGHTNEDLIIEGNVILDDVENKFVFYCEVVEEGDWILERHEDGKWFVKEYKGSEKTSLTIPATIGDRNIYGVDTFSYDGNELIISDGIKVVKKFGGKMKKITIPSSVTDMGTQYTLRYCSALENAIVKASVEMLPPGFLYESTSVTSVELPEGLKTIGQEAFKGCSDLSTIALPNSIETIGAYAFSKCRALTSLAFPESLKTIGIGAFMESGLIDVDLTHVRDLYEEAFYGSALKTLKIPSTVTEIKSDAENGVTGPFGFTVNGPVSVTLTGTWNSIPANMFKSMKLDDGFTIPDTVTSIGDNAFAYAEFKPEVENGPVAISLSDDIVSIGTSAFAGTNITSIKLPSGLRMIPDWCFEKCSKLETVTMPAAVESIGKCAFNECIKVKRLDNLQDVKSLGASVFNGMTSLENLVLSDNVKVLPGNFINGCTSLKSFVIPGTVTELGVCCFQDSGLTELVVPVSVKAANIGRYAFYGMKDCTRIELQGIRKAEASDREWFSPKAPYTVVYADTITT